MILLPQLEHSLRRVYACCNNLPKRLQTAESSELYTTFNEVSLFRQFFFKVLSSSETYCKFRNVLKRCEKRTLCNATQCLRKIFVFAHII